MKRDMVRDHGTAHEDPGTLSWDARPGTRVEVRRGGHFVQTGTVETVSDDCKRLWLAPEGVNLRRLFDHGEGYEVIALEAQNPAQCRGTAGTAGKDSQLQR